MIKKDGNFLKEYREQLGLTQKEFAERTGVNINTIQNIEQNKRKGSDDTWEKILNTMEENKKNSKFIHSIDSEEVIEKIKQDIVDLSEDAICYVFYNTHNGATEFIDCFSELDINEEIIDFYSKQNIFFVESKLKYALKLFELQDKTL